MRCPLTKNDILLNSGFRSVLISPLHLERFFLNIPRTDSIRGIGSFLPPMQTQLHRNVSTKSREERKSTGHSRKVQNASTRHGSRKIAHLMDKCLEHSQHFSRVNIKLKFVKVPWTTNIELEDRSILHFCRNLTWWTVDLRETNSRRYELFLRQRGPATR